MWGNKAGAQSKGLLPGRATIGPLLLLTLCPLFTLTIYHNLTKQNGSITNLVKLFIDKGFRAFPADIFPAWNNVLGQWKLVGSFMAIELLLMRILPGSRFEGPVAPSGHVPVYKANGVAAFLVSIALYGAASYFKWYTPGTVYNNLGPIFAFLVLFSLFFCLLLCFKGYYFPSTKDSGTTGNLVVDYFWGTELYPRILGFDVKTFTNCRFGMMSWGLLVIEYTLAQYFRTGHFVDSTVVSAVLQLIYVFKFFWWETGYWRSLDIMHDRAGFYICWGCLCWVPSVYTSHTMYLATYELHLGLFKSAIFLALGLLMIWVNYDSDRQRFEFREKKGKYKIWGKDADYIVAPYTTEKGKKKIKFASCQWLLGVISPFPLRPRDFSRPFLDYPSTPEYYALLLRHLLDFVID
jgi:7-dehydrocholesterol reductase